MHEISATLIDQIVALRKSKNLSQRQLAAMTGLTQPFIARFELKKSQPTVETVCRILEALDSTLTISKNDA